MSEQRNNPNRKNTPNPRMIAFKVLMRVEGEDGYSNIALSEALSAAKPEPRDRAFITRLVYGVLEKTETLDHVISSYLKPGARIEPEVRCLLRMAVYQMAFMNIPDAAAVNESVNLAKQRKLFRATGFINGLLRNFIRDGKEVRLPDPVKQREKYLSIKYACPLWLVKLWRDSYGNEIAEKILHSLEGRPPIFLRVNTARVTTGELVERLKTEGVKASASEKIPDCLVMEESGDITALPEYQEGLFHVQDASSQLCCMAAAPGAGSVVYDVCAAPGGKSFSLAELMGNEGKVIACDLHPHRVELIAEGAKRLGLSCIEPTVRDALGEGTPACADLVLCDAPCSGLGIIRRKPDIKRKPPEEIQALPDLQYRILDNSSRLVRKGGRLVYSTCTLNPAENHAVIGKFLDEHGEFEPCPLSLPDGIPRAIDEPDWQITLFPHMMNTDGFFISAVRRKD
ncbi:MAG: 16S rRNA (cytosine(967)-C(5))-methyltransferase RsmB [Clostridia bacterium]|nr:16S rRNA (cytosine(967)-C(5))-methyltransferase RsmB [Clostridia bacterium]